MEKKKFNQNELVEKASTILKTVFNGYYETRLLRVDLKTKDWTHAINTARRMPLTTLYEEEKRNELVRIFMILRGDVISQEEGLQSGFLHPVGKPETEVGEVSSASTEEPVDVTAAPVEETPTETAESPLEEAHSNVAPTETAETTVLEEVTVVPEEVTKTEAPDTEEIATEETATEEPVAEETVEADPVETIVEASEEKAEETETEETPKSRRHKK